MNARSLYSLASATCFLIAGIAFSGTLAVASPLFAAGNNVGIEVITP